ncbi:MAG: hypothetical protein ACYC8T_08995 [Myxococcaceae bacterium]
MRRSVAAVVVLVAGCNFSPARPCGSDSDCEGEARCDVELGACVAGGGGGGAGGGGGGGAGGGGGGTAVCDPACAPWQECEGSQCMARYAGIVLDQPGANAVVGGAGLEVVARLVLNAGRAPFDPSALDLLASADGGTSTTPGALTRFDAGVYRGMWLGPAQEGRYELQAAHPSITLGCPKVPVVVDRTAPTFTVVVPPAARQLDGGATSFVDPAAGFAGAYRRDERVTVTVSTAEPHLDTAAGTLTVIGVADGGPGLSGQAMPLTGWAPCGTNQQCASAEVDLALPEFKAFRGTVGLAVQGRDLGGNEGSGDAGVAVTRWKWAFNPNAGPIKTSPAIGSTGTVYFGTASSNGLFLAVAPEGTVRWAVDAGSFEASPSIGRSDSGVDVVFMAANGLTDTTLYALRAEDAGVLTSCPYPGAILGSLASADLTRSGKLLSSGVAVANDLSAGGYVVAVRPGGVTGGDRCNDLSGVGTVDFRGGVATNGTDFFFAKGTSSTTVRAVTFSENWTNRWTAQTNLFTRTPAVVGSNVIVGGGLSEGGVVSLGSDGGVEWRLGIPIAAGAIPNASSPSVAAGGAVLTGTEDGRLLRATIGADAGVYVPAAGPILGGVAVGQGSLYYSATQGGVVQAWGSNLQPLWSVSSLGNDIQSSVALDCARSPQGAALPGRPGTLYLGSNNGKLYAFVVDSRGIDTTAPWPKYQHDPRNTGNSSTALSEFSCP